MTDRDEWSAERLARLVDFSPIEAAIHNPEGIISIRAAGLEQAADVFAVMQSAFTEHRGVLDPPSGADSETIQDVANAIAEGGALLACDGDTPVAGGRFRLHVDHLYVGRLGVVPSHRGRGVAQALMAAMERVARLLDCDEIRLGTRMRLPGNLALYKKLGYEIVDVRTHARGPDQIALLVKRLADESE